MNQESQVEERRAPAAPVFRPDIEGLRAVAVVLVVLLHAGFTGLSGGYVGVDVFFVISGFLITSLLINELQRTERVSFLNFYARRARRILPVASIVIAVTVVATYLALGPLAGRGAAIDGRWAAVFLANLRFIHEGTHYFASSLPPSPLLHFWSLAVEEQFYLVWPALLVLLAVVGRRVGRPTAVLRGGLILVVAASLAWSIHETALNPSAAYFSPFTRAWELGAGAILAAYPTRIGRAPAFLRAAATWIGLGLILMASLMFSASTEFPGYTAIVPVLGSALVIAGGIRAPAGGAAMLLATRPMRVVGRLSFSIYLWHWPILVIAEEHSPTPLSVAARAECVAAAVALSVLSYLFVESPFRSSRWLHIHSARNNWGATKRSLALGAAAIVLATAAAAYTGNRAILAINAASRTAPSGRSLSDKINAQIARASAGDEAGPRASPSSPSATKTAVSALEQRFLDAQAKVVAAVRAAATLHRVPSDVDPPVLQIGQTDNPYYERCGNALPDPQLHVCTYGDVSSSRRMFVLGDSHVGTWLGALDVVAQQAHMRIDALSKPACTLAAVPAPTYESATGAWTPFPACTAWHAAAVAAVVAARPSLVVLVVTHNASAIPEDELAAGMQQTYRDLARSGAALVQISDNAELAEDPSVCLARANADPTACAGSFPEDAVSHDAATAGAAGVGYIDVEPWLCISATTCPVIIDNRIAYANSGHLSYQYAVDLAPLLGAALDYVQSR